MSDVEQERAATEWSDTLLGKGAIQQRMKCKGVVASNIEKTFVTVEQLLEAVESEEPLTAVDGVGPATAEVIEDWYEHREEREANARRSTFKRTSNTSATISFHRSWADALGIEVPDSE